MAAFAPVPFAIPTPRFLVRRAGFEWLYHYTPLAALDGIVRAVSGRDGDWTAAELELQASSGWSRAAGRLLRDYSLLDFELKLRGRGAYTYFFGGEPSAWGLRKNLGIRSDLPAEEQGLGILRVRLEALLDRYDGPLFYRPDDAALVIRGGYAGPGQVTPVPHRLRAAAS